MEKSLKYIGEIEKIFGKVPTPAVFLSCGPPDIAEWAPIAEKVDLMVGQSTAMLRLVGLAYKMAKKNMNILIQGETGTGKEKLASFIHAASSCSRQVFFPVNCGALPDNLVASELFGHERGAFTDAVNLRRGVFERADKGTLFLDEIGEISPTIQVKLLRVLETGVFMRIGGEELLKTDVRVIAATNVNLELAVQNKTFRRDLYYRLSGVRLEIPPLRERREDIPLLVNYFVRKMDPDLLISPETMRLLCDYPWPGNVRELFNCISQAVALSDDKMILPEHLGDKIVSGKPGWLKTGKEEHCPCETFSLKGLNAFLDHYTTNPAGLEDISREELSVLLKRVRCLGKNLVNVMEGCGSEHARPLSLREAEIWAISEALDFHRGNITNAARSLGIGRNTLSRKIKEYGIRIKKSRESKYFSLRYI